MVVWASSTMVQARINSRTPLTVENINTLIDDSERYFSALMKTNDFLDGTITFNQVKHGILRDAAAARAALLVLATSSMSWFTLEQAAFDADVLYQVVLGYINILSDQDYVSWLRSL